MSNIIVQAPDRYKNIELNLPVIGTITFDENSQIFLTVDQWKELSVLDFGIKLTEISPVKEVVADLIPEILAHKIVEVVDKIDIAGLNPDNTKEPLIVTEKVDEIIKSETEILDEKKGVEIATATILSETEKMLNALTFIELRSLAEDNFSNKKNAWNTKTEDSLRKYLVKQLQQPV